MTCSFSSILSFPSSITTTIIAYAKPSKKEREIEDAIYRIFAKKIIQDAVSSVFFLDIDGVVYTSPKDDSIKKMVQQLYPLHRGVYIDEMYNIAATHFFNQKAMMHLKMLLSSRDIAIVLSSRWRLFKSVPQLRKEFAACFFAKYIVDKTAGIDDDEYLFCRKGLITDFTGRGAEITDWLRNHADVNYVIIDDLDDDLSKGQLAERFVKIDGDLLMTKADAKKAIKILNQHEKPQ